MCDLSGSVDMSSFAQQQADHLSVSLLGSQVQGADSLLGQNIGFCFIL